MQPHQPPLGGTSWRSGKDSEKVAEPPGSDTLRFCEGLERALRLATRVPDTHIEKARVRRKALSKYTRKPTRERLLDKLIEREVFVDEQIDKIAQMVF